jgi:hypothetical protein
MPSLERMRDRLPSLYRPEDDDTGLLMLFLLAVAGMLESLNREAGEVMQSHWLDYADRALYSPYFILTLKLARPPKSVPAANAKELRMFPYIHDLARLGSLLPLPPWQEPPAQRELAEHYRKRINDTVEIYKNGLGTTGALRGVVENQLPPIKQPGDAEAARPFFIEEFAPLSRQSLAVAARGEPTDMVGPLMRWTFTNSGVDAVPPTLFIQGVAAQPEAIDQTINPLIELYQAGDKPTRIAIGYKDTLAPGLTLRLRPSFASWLGLQAGLRRALAKPDEDDVADPTAPGPWQTVADAPEGEITAICQAQDRALWVASNEAEGGSLYRFDGQTWTEVLTARPALHALIEDGPDLLIGTESGLLRLRQHPEDDAALTANPVAAADKTVHALFRAADGRLWVGMINGAAILKPDDTLQLSPLRDVPVFSITQDKTGTLYFGTALGVFQNQPGLDHWYWYRGQEITEQKPDWQRFFPDLQGDRRMFPVSEQVFLPPVTCAHRGQDSSLWLGTRNGIARYVARSVRGLTYETVLEAFPDVAAGQVFDIKEDVRGLMWFCTDRGLLRFDGRDWWQFQAGDWNRLALALGDEPAHQRGAWRFQRAAAQWERFNPARKIWEAHLDPPLSRVEPAARTIAWVDEVAADLGEWDGTGFKRQRDADAGKLLMRFKPDETRIVKGGIPAVPRLPVGESTWRYLSLETEAAAVPKERPAWTTEGRLLPPPAELAAPGEGRYDITTPPPPSSFDQAVFAYNPAARVWAAWNPRSPLTVLVRLKAQSPGENIDPVILDRVTQGMQQVRPAGVRAALAVEEIIVR